MVVAGQIVHSAGVTESKRSCHDIGTGPTVRVWQGVDIDSSVCSRNLRLIAAMFAAAMIATGCGAEADENQQSGAPTSGTVDTAASTESASAELMPTTPGTATAPTQKTPATTSAPTTTPAIPPLEPAAMKSFGEHSGGCPPTVVGSSVDEVDINPILPAAAECFLGEHAVGRPVTWDVLIMSTEGDPIPWRYDYDGTMVTITKDSSFDTFSSDGVTEQICGTVTATDWLPYGEDCTTAEGTGFIADTLPSGPTTRDAMDAAIPLVAVTGRPVGTSAPYFGRQDGSGGAAAPAGGFTPEFEHRQFCWAVDVINHRPQPSDDFEQVVVGQTYMEAITPYAPAELSRPLQVIIGWAAAIIDQGSMGEPDEAAEFDDVAAAVDAVNRCVDEHCLGLHSDP